MPEGEEEMQRMRVLKHDIRNQLSNMYLAIDHLKHELAQLEAGQFALFCVDTIAESCQAINKRIEGFE